MRIYIHDRLVPSRVQEDFAWLQTQPCGVQDAYYAAMEGDRVNVCSNCGVIQDMPEYNGQLIEWAPDDPGEQLCLECFNQPV